MRELTRASLLLTASRILGIGLQAIVVFYLAHRLRIEDMGYFGLIYALLGLVRFLGPLGTDQVALRRIAKPDRVGPDDSTISIASLVLTVAAILALLVLVVVAAVFGILAPLSPAAIAAIVVAVPAFALTGSFIGQIRGLGRNLAAQMPEATGLHVVFGLLLLACSTLGALTLDTVLACLAAAAWSITLTYAALRWPLGAHPSAWPHRDVLAEMAREGGQVFQALAVTALGFRAPLLLSTALMGPAATAVIEIAGRFGRITDIVTSSIALTFSPHLARFDRGADARTLHKVLRHGATMAAIPALGWLVVVWVAAPRVLGSLLPPAYAEAYVPTVLMAAAAAINSICGLASTLLLMSGREAVVRRYSLGQLLAICLVSLVLEPQWGVSGIAAAVVLGALVRDGGMMLYVLTVAGSKVRQ